MDYEYEYGRYKKKVADQQKEIEELKGYIDGMKQVMQANNAIIAAMLHTIGSNEMNPMVLKQEVINQAVMENWTIMSMLDNVAKVHMVYVREHSEKSEAGE